VHTALLEIRDAQQRIELARTALAQATENLRLIRSLFQRGDALPTEVVDAEVVFERAQENQAAALYDHQTALARLAFAVGVPLERLLGPAS
jgi:outer membrane protein TolC